MGKPTGFLEITRLENPFRSVQERVRDSEYLHTCLPENARRDQASRCMNCGVPFCQSAYGCPLHNLIPEWNDLITSGADREAVKRLLITSSFPEFTGRVCPGLCEKACNLEWEGATTNRDNELYLIERAFAAGWMIPRIPRVRTGRRALVVGAGPAGLAAADMLNKLGHTVEVVERADRAGGLMMYGIPNMKLPKNVIDRRISLMEQEGVVFHMGVEANAETLNGFDAVVLACGAKKPRGLNVPGADADGVHFAVDYLSSATKALLNAKMPAISAEGKHVVIVGGGDTGNDCAGTAIRQGCISLTALELMPAPPIRRAKNNPWPEWPRVLGTDYGQEEAIEIFGADPRLFSTTVKDILVNERGKVQAVTIHQVRMENGSFEPVPGTERTIPCDLLLIAAGFVGPEDSVIQDFNLVRNRSGVESPLGGHQVRKGLFAAGDMRTGQSLVVRAIAEGRQAAMEIDRYLQSEEFYA